MKSNREPSPDEILFKEEKLEKYVKNNCVMCGRALHDPTNNYIVRGNYCTGCTGFCERMVKQRRKAGVRSKLEQLVDTFDKK
jgi:hypothetical protein